MNKRGVFDDISDFIVSVLVLVFIFIGFSLVLSYQQNSFDNAVKGSYFRSNSQQTIHDVLDFKTNSGYPLYSIIASLPGSEPELSHLSTDLAKKKIYFEVYDDKKTKLFGSFNSCNLKYSESIIIPSRGDNTLVVAFYLCK